MTQRPLIIRALLGVMVAIIVAVGGPATAQEVSRWDGLYRCIPSQDHCAAGWLGTIRISGGRISGDLSADLPGGFFEGTLSGTIDSFGKINARLPMRALGSGGTLNLDVRGAIWEATAGVTKRKFFGGTTREVVARLRFITPAQLAEMNRAKREREATPTGERTTTRRTTPGPPSCRSGQGSYTIREAPDDDSRSLRSGGGCFDDIAFTITHRVNDDWVAVQMADGRAGFVELSNASFRAYAVAALSVEPPTTIELAKKSREAGNRNAPSGPTSSQRPTPAQLNCKSGQGSYVIRLSPNENANIIRTGGGCLDDITFKIARRHNDRWIAVHTRDGLLGYVELNSAPLRAYVAAALAPKPAQEKVAEADASCSSGHVTYTLRTAASSDAEVAKTEQVCIDDLDLVFIERVARSSWYAVREPGGPQRFVDVTDNVSLATLAERGVFRDTQRPPGQQQAATSATCRSGIADYTIRALPLDEARILHSSRGCLDNVPFEVVSTTSEAGWYLIRLPTGRIAYVDTGESRAMENVIAARTGTGTAAPVTVARTTPPRAATPPAAVAQKEAPRPEQPPALEPVDQRYVATKNANVRSKPNVRAALIETLPKGAVITALGRVRDADWFLIARDGEQLGYVFAPLVALEGSPAAVAALAPPRPTVEVNKNAVAVIIGNKAYGGDVPNVSYAHNDADAMKRHVIETLGYREGNIIDLRDATLADFNRVFGTDRSRRAQLANWIRDGRSDVTVFYSGHGVPGLSDGRGYLLPVDGDPNLAELTGYSLDTMVANLSQLAARSVQVFIDACFSGNSAGGTLLRATSGIGLSPALPGAGPTGLVVITAASGDQVASWDDDARHGLFTQHLLAALRGTADGADWGDGDGRVSLGEVKTYLDDEMTFQARKRFNRHQTATISGGSTTILAARP